MCIHLRYHCDPSQPLGFAGLGSQKRHMALYLMGVYGDAKLSAAFGKAWKATGKKLDMGKSCVRFKSLDDVPLEVVGDVIAKVSAARYIKQYEAMLAKTAAGRKKTPRKAAKKVAKKTVANQQAAQRVGKKAR